jgi:hypothetical protein
MVFQRLFKILSKKRWQYLIAIYSPQKICAQISFKEAMHLVERLFFEDFRNNDNQQFGLKLVVEIRQFFTKDWKSDWKNDVFLGDMYNLLYFDVEGYNCCKRAYDSLTNPPESLLLSMAYYFGSENSILTEKEYEFYVRMAIEKKLTSESALMMRTLYRSRGDKDQEKHWNQIYEKLENDNVHSEVITPNVFKIE